MPAYTHTLVPHRVDFVPGPDQVAQFLSELISIGAAPLKPTISLSKPTGEVRRVTSRFTGTTRSFPLRRSDALENVAAVAGALNGLGDYNVTVTGEGPPKVPALVFDFEGTYAFLVHCCLRTQVVSTSDWHTEVPMKRKVESFGEPCSAKDRLGIFHNPHTLQLIKVPKAGCARFWIELEFGKMLFPAIKDRLDIAEPKIVQAAESNLGIKFAQGCHWFE